VPRGGSNAEGRAQPDGRTPGEGGQRLSCLTTGANRLVGDRVGIVVGIRVQEHNILERADEVGGVKADKKEDGVFVKIR
jgi:hypothetical protein